MTYQYSIQIKPSVNFHTKAAEVSVTDHTYDGSGKGIIVRQKHIGTAESNEQAEVAAEDFCKRVHARLKAVCEQELAHLQNAKP